MERFPPSNVDLKVFLGGFCSEIIYSLYEWRKVSCKRKNYCDI